ncbi:MAG: hypothetical protein AAGI63_06325 [Planctomycetota bacterium]
MIDRPSVESIASAIGDVEIPDGIHAFLDALSTPHARALRLRRDVSVEQIPIPLQQVPWYSLGYQPTNTEIKPARLWRFTTGDFYLQDAGSFLALAAASADSDELSGQLICDLCASPGGKASALLEAINASEPTVRSGFVLANEVIQSRLGPLQWNLARTGSDRYAISKMDPERLADTLPGIFDWVLVDAPCSGQALLGRGKQKLAALSTKQIDHSASRQQRILDAAIRLVRPGGKLIYSTCTFAQAENESQIHRLTESNQCVANDHPDLDPYRTSPGCYRLWPQRHDCAGSFAASMTVQDKEDETRIGRNSIRWPKPEPCRIDEIAELFPSDHPRRLHATDSTVMDWPEDVPPWVEHVAVAGPELLHRTGRTWKPSHAAALRRNAHTPDQVFFDVDERAAQAFMRGEPIPSNQSGWQVVRYLERPLGWAKGNGQTAKNHLPGAARNQGAELIT